MNRFISRAVFGLCLGLAVTAIATLLIGNGHLLRWSISVGGETICSDPYVWIGSREIECD